MSAPLDTTMMRSCPICLAEVKYFKGLWFHADTGHWLKTDPERHDVNTYAPDRLLDHASQLAKLTVGN